MMTSIHTWCRLTALALLVGSLVIGHAVRGAIPTFRGDEEDYWTVEKRAVIVAVVKSVDAGGRSPGEMHGELIPQMTLAGWFDPSLTPSLRVIFWARAEGYQSSLAKSPKPGDTVIVVVQPPDAERMHPDIVATGRHVVPVDRCEFMLGEEPLVVIESASSPEVSKTLARLQAKRTKAQPADKRPPTRPSN